MGVKGLVAASVVAATCWVTGAILHAQQPVTPATAQTGRTINAIGYPVSGGTVTIDFKETGLISPLTGTAKVSAKPGVTNVEVNIQGLESPAKLGAEFLTYVLWAVSPDGRAINLGGIPVNNGKGTLKTTTQLQTFSLFVTAEPYSAVRQPSEMLVLENVLRQGTKGKIFPVNNYPLMKRAQYQKLGNPLALTPDLKNVPLEMYEARNAVEIARARQADQYAPEVFSKAEGGLKIAERALSRKADRKEIISLARQASQFAEDARALSIERQETARIEAERAAVAAAAAAKAKAEAEAEAKRRADEEAKRQEEIAAAREAQMKAEAAARQAEAEAAAAKAKAEADAIRAKEEAARADAERARKATAELRAQLLDQFNRILETRESARGLVITMADVLFDTGRYNLKSDTREKLARLSGIMLAHTGLRLAIEGHTDNVGSEELNQALSEKRAQTVRDYLVLQGLLDDFVTARGFGMTMPIADNSTAAGRQQNRRVEIIVSGEVIGVKIGQ
jgi:outer membrane protein OmpA-like peptidoglycan-associated protein